MLSPGELAEFDTSLPHALGRADGNPVELLILFGQQGERADVRARIHLTRRIECTAFDGAPQH